MSRFFLFFAAISWSSAFAGEPGMTFAQMSAHTTLSRIHPRPTVAGLLHNAQSLHCSLGGRRPSAATVQMSRSSMAHRCRGEKWQWAHTLVREAKLAGT